MDMTESIAPKSDQMNAEDLLTGPRTFTITDVRVGGGPDQPVSVYLAEFPADRPFKPSKTVRRLLVVAWGPDATAYIGKRLTLYRDPQVRFGGQDVGGIRVSHMSDIPRTLTVPLTVTRGRRAPFVVEPLTGGAPAAGDPGRIARMLASFAGVGVTEDTIAGKLGRPRAAWSADDVDRMAGVFRALTAGEVTREEAFGRPTDVTVDDLGPDPAAPAVAAPRAAEPDALTANRAALAALRVTDEDVPAVLSGIIGIPAPGLDALNADGLAAVSAALTQATELPADDPARADKVEGWLVDGTAILAQT